jgi:hypothetical protein
MYNISEVIHSVCSIIGTEIPPLRGLLSPQIKELHREFFNEH